MATESPTTEPIVETSFDLDPFRVEEEEFEPTPPQSPVISRAGLKHLEFLKISVAISLGFILSTYVRAKQLLGPFTSFVQSMEDKLTQYTTPSFLRLEKFADDQLVFLDDMIHYFFTHNMTSLLPSRLKDNVEGILDSVKETYSVYTEEGFCQAVSHGYHGLSDLAQPTLRVALQKFLKFPLTPQFIKLVLPVFSWVVDEYNYIIQCLRSDFVLYTSWVGTWFPIVDISPVVNVIKEDVAAALKTD